ncbi:MAG: ATPase, T2SS/T4P/T4SS family [Candidatus Nanopelagicales bacterium]
MDACAHVGDQVRRTIRDDGLDLLADPHAVRTAINDAVEAFVASCADGSLPGWVGAVPESTELSRQVEDSVVGLGPLQRYLDDPDIEEIWINEPGRVFVARSGRSELTSTVLTDQLIRDLVERMLTNSGRRLDVSSPFVDAPLADGSRLHVVIPDITKSHWAINIRKFVCRARHVADLVGLGVLSQQAGDFLAAAVVSGLNIVVAGGTQAGKTTTLNALLGCVPARERVITCEETFELQLPDHPDWVALQTRQAGLEGTGEVTLRNLVREALRMRPTRLIVGEVRQHEALDLLIAMNSGMPSMASVHANSAREAVTKLCTLPLLAGSNIAADFVVPTVAGCVDLVVHLHTNAAGQRRVSEIAALSGRVEQGTVEMAPIFELSGGQLRRSDGFPPHVDRFERAGFDLTALLGSQQRSAS